MNCLTWWARLRYLVIPGYGMTEPPQRMCQAPGCNEPIPPGARPHRRTCSPACRKALSRMVRKRHEQHPEAFSSWSKEGVEPPLTVAQEIWGPDGEPPKKRRKPRPGNAYWEKKKDRQPEPEVEPEVEPEGPPSFREMIRREREGK